MNLLLIALGGALGATTRYLTGLAIMKKWDQPPIPVAMLFVNVAGSFALGLFFSYTYRAIPIGANEEPFYLFFGIGFFGAFTTFSTFSMETIGLLQKQLYKKAILYVALSILGSLFMFIIGFLIGGIF